MTEPENPVRLSAPVRSAGDENSDNVPLESTIHDLVRFRMGSSLRFDLLGRNFEDITGLNAALFLNGSSRLTDIAVDTDREQLQLALEKSLKSGAYLSARFRIRTQSADIKWIWMRGPAVIPARPGLPYIEGVMSDISTQLQAEEALLAERELFRVFADALDDGICILSDDFTIKFMNRSLIDLVGDRTGETCYKALFCRDGCCAMPGDIGEGEQFRSCWFRPQVSLPGSSLVFHARSLPIATSAGFKGRIGQLRDISKLKKIERRFRDFAIQVRAIAKAADMADLGIFILVNSDKTEAQFCFATPAFCRITGFTTEELLNMGLAEVVHPDDMEPAMLRYRSRLKGEPMGDTYEIKLLRKDKIPITVFFMGALVKHYGKTATVGFVRDITVRKQLQESLLLSQRLASIGKLSAEIAHEINNPLTSVLAFNKLLERLIQQQPFPIQRIPEMQDYVHYVNNEASRCAEIARNLLNFSRTTEIRIKEHDIHEVIEKTLGILRHRAEMSNITIITDYARDVPPVHCDFSRIQQALINILWNALDAMPQGGVLTVSTSFDAQPQCKFQCKSGKNMVQVTISDTGVGIPKENLDRIFEPFFSTKKEKTGVGLGLSVAYGIVSKHNGQILVQSEPGNGSCFQIQLPTNICTTCPFAVC
ncbi:MAG: PAS domain S-box protein [Syntrophobacter sp.]